MALNQASDLDKADGKTRVRVVTEVRQTSQRTQMIFVYRMLIFDPDGKLIESKLDGEAAFWM
jgi:hypothetical protein